MKILLISNMYPNKKHPFYGVFVKNFAQGLEKKNIVIDKVILFKKTNKVTKLIGYINLYVKIILSVLFKKYDVVYVHYASHVAFLLIFLKKIKNINLIVNVHGSDVIPKKSSQEKYQKHVKKLLEVCNKIVVPSEYFKGIVNSKYELNKNKIKISPSGGINKKIFYPIKDINNIKKLKINYNIDENNIVITYAGRLEKSKGWDIYLKMIKELVDRNQFEDKIALFIGSGEQNNEFEEMVNKLQIKEYLIKLPLLAQVDLNNIYNITDIFCFPTKSESLGLVGVEAMASGTPVVGSDIEALKEYIVNQETGMLFKEGDYLDFAEKIIELNNDLKEENLKKIYIKKCLNMANKYASNKVDDDMFKFIKNEIHI